MGNRYKYISDLHLNHKNINDYGERPYKNVDEMNEGIIKEWNQRTNEEDIVFVIGDIGFGYKHILGKQIKSLRGKKHLILGNHDKNGKIKHETYEDCFQSFTIFQVVNDKGLNILLIHDIENMANIVNPKILRGIDLILCGHVHRKWFKTNIIWNYKKDIGEIEALNVSIELLQYPRTIKEILEIQKTLFIANENKINTMEIKIR